MAQTEFTSSYAFTGLCKRMPDQKRTMNKVTFLADEASLAMSPAEWWDQIQQKD